MMVSSPALLVLGFLTRLIPTRLGGLPVLTLFAGLLFLAVPQLDSFTRRYVDGWEDIGSYWRFGTLLLFSLGVCMIGWSTLGVYRYSFITYLLIIGRMLEGLILIVGLLPFHKFWNFCKAGANETRKSASLWPVSAFLASLSPIVDALWSFLWEYFRRRVSRMLSVVSTGIVCIIIFINLRVFFPGQSLLFQFILIYSLSTYALKLIACLWLADNILDYLGPSTTVGLALALTGAHVFSFTAVLELFQLTQFSDPLPGIFIAKVGSVFYFASVVPAGAFIWNFLNNRAASVDFM